MSWRVAGFSLVELMVTLAVMAVLAATGTPFAREWIDSNRQIQARNVMWEAVSQARSLALRNPTRAITGAVSARLQRDGRALQVLRGDGTEVLWRGELPRNVQIKLTGAVDFADADDLSVAANDLACVAFGSRGQRLPAAGGCPSGVSHQRLAIGLHNQGPLYVDLL
ncbi:pilus assembly FimT family protein [Stenotrophomonas humi]